MFSPYERDRFTRKRLSPVANICERVGSHHMLTGRERSNPSFLPEIRSYPYSRTNAPTLPLHVQPAHYLEIEPYTT